MKTLRTSKTIVALAVAIAASAANISNAYEQPIPPPASEAGLPAGIVPGSDLAQVLKLAQANVELSVINNFIANTRGTFNLDAAKIIALNDAGVPSQVLDTMLEHDRQFIASNQAPPPAAPVVVQTVTTAPPPVVSVNYFNDTLSPYGNWVEVNGYGRCWRPTTVVYDTNWRPYCDRGHWVNTDCGWYWDSDYAWGSTFHYGRWFRDTRFGWCWWPETTWAPSWVVWRSGEEHCGWAPLPPRCVYERESGFFYNGSHVSVGFDFGLREDCFTFVSFGHVFDRHVRDHREDSRHATQIYNHTTVINNYNFNGSRNTVVNNGISTDRVSAATHHPVPTVAVNELPNAQRHGWRGEGRNDRAPGGAGNSAANHTGYNQNDAGTHGANSGGRVGGNVSSPVTVDSNGQRGHGNAFGNSSTQTGNQPANPAAGGKVYSQDAGREPARQVGSSVGQQTQNPQTSFGNDNRGQHSSRLDQQSSRGQNQIVTPSIVTTPPQRSVPQVEQPQIIHPQTPAQMGQVLDRNTHSSRLEQQRNQSAAFINTTPPQRSDLQVQPPQIIRPTIPSAVLTPSSGVTDQRAQQLNNRVNQFQRNTERSVESYSERAPNRSQPAVQAPPTPPPQPQHTERAAAPASRSNGDSQKSDKDKK